VTSCHAGGEGDGKRGAGKGGIQEGADSKAFIPYGPLQRFREHPELFEEILTLDKYAVFEVRNKGKI
jgi:hypothetical protein